MVPTSAPFFQGAKLLIAADCTAYAYAAFHEEFIKGRITLVGCPKLDSVDYTEKLTEIIRNNDIQSVTVVRMEVPCCGGTVAIVQDAQYEPDGRLKLIKGIRQCALELKFTAQSQGMLIDWLIRRFSAAGKSIELEAAQRLIFISGDLMSRLIPEIEKVAAYAKGDRVTVADVEAVANHIPEAVVFDMTDYIAQKKYNTAMAVLAELISDKNNAPIAMVAMIGQQMRRLYGAKLASAQPDGMKALMDACGIKYEFIAKKLIASARGFTLPQLVRAVELCADADYKMKSSSTDDTELLKELVLRIAAGEADA